MHVYSAPLRSPFAFPCVPWNFEVGNASDQKLEVGELRSRAYYYTLTTANNGTAAAAVSGDVVKSLRITIHASIFTAELLVVALNLALDIIRQSRGKNLSSSLIRYLVW